MKLQHYLGGLEGLDPISLADHPKSVVLVLKHPMRINERGIGERGQHRLQALRER